MRDSQMIVVVMAGVKVFHQVAYGDPASQLYKHHGNELRPARQFSDSVIAIMPVNHLLKLVTGYRPEQLLKNAVMMLHACPLPVPEKLSRQWLF